MQPLRILVIQDLLFFNIGILHFILLYCNSQTLRGVCVGGGVRATPNGSQGLLLALTQSLDHSWQCSKLYVVHQEVTVRIEPAQLRAW